MVLHQLSTKKSKDDKCKSLLNVNAMDLGHLRKCHLLKEFSLCFRNCLISLSMYSVKIHCIWQLAIYDKFNSAKLRL